MAHLTTKQIKQLVEIDNAGPGIRAEVQELIRRLTSGGVGPQSDDPLITQAKKLWDKGFGRELGKSFDEYLDSIPDIPSELNAHDKRFPLLVLVDARLGTVKTCKLLGVNYPGDDETFVDYDPKKSRTNKVYGIRAQDGRKNHGKSVQTCRKQFAEDEIGLTVHEGLALFAQNPEGIRNRGMDLPGSVRRENRDSAAGLRWFFEHPELYWLWNGYEQPGYGSASRRA